MIIGICGPMRAGKSTIARHLEKNNRFLRLPMAQPLKRMLHAAGLTEEDTDGKSKEKPHPLLLGKTPRHAMQTLGTEWARHHIGDEFWANLWQTQAVAAMKSGKYAGIVCDDLRFGEEAALIRGVGGTIWKLRRADVEIEDAAHESERYWRTMQADVELENTGQLRDLLMAVDHLVTPAAAPLAALWEAKS